MTASAEVPSAEDPSAEDRGPGAEPRQDLPPEEHRPDERRKMTVSERDIGTLAADLEGWLAGRLGHPEGLTVSGVRVPGSGGLSSTSVLFEAGWTSAGRPRQGAYVARMAPEAGAVPVFPSYDLAGQFAVISQVAARSKVPLPRLRWNEPDGGPLGYRTVSDAKRVWPDGRVEQLGWPRTQISYRPGTRHPESARIHLQGRAGGPLALEVETVTSVPLHVGAGYGGDPDWSHGRWMGRDWSQASVYDLTDPAVAGRIPFGVIDHLARAWFAGEEGWGLFEHASMGRHDPSGFADWSSVAP